MRIKVISVGKPEKEKNYFFYNLTYDKDGKEETKKMFSFAEAAYAALKGANEGDLFDVKLAKNKNGYWEWSEVVPALAGSTTSATTRSGSWETAEERARRQILIVRQSSLSNAIAYASSDPKAPLDLVIEVAAQFEAWVNRE